MTNTEDQAEPPPEPRRRWREVLSAFLIVALLSFLLDLLGQSIPIIGRYLLTLVAIVFLTVPILILKRAGRHDTEYGLGFDDIPRGLRWGIGTTIVTAILFAPAFHLYHAGYLNYDSVCDLELLSGPPDKTLGTPTDTSDGDVHIYSKGEWIFVQWSPPTTPATLTIQGEDGLQFYKESSDTIRKTATTTGEIKAYVLPQGLGTLTIHASTQDTSSQPINYALGTSGAEADARDGKAKVPVNYWWIVTMLLAQVLLVALPEEFFYRGYLQERLSEGIGRTKWLTIGPLYITPAIVITSALFAIGHLIIGWDPMRLLVFFPALLFGWLRERTDGITAPIIYHAACNMMVQLMSAFYML